MSIPSVDSGSLLSTPIVSSAFLGRGFLLSSLSKPLPKWGYVSTYGAGSTPSSTTSRSKLAQDPYCPHMPFKVTCSIDQVIVDFENIVVALQLIAAFTLWVWLYAVANLLAHYSGPLYFD